MIIKFDLRNTTKEEFVRTIEANDRKFGSHAMSWDGQVVTVGWAKQKAKHMGKLHEIAQRMAKAKEKMHAEADKLADRLTQFETKAPDAFANAHSVLNEQDNDLSAMEDELRQLSNGS